MNIRKFVTKDITTKKFYQRQGAVLDIDSSEMPDNLIKISTKKFTTTEDPFAAFDTDEDDDWLDWDD